MHIWNVVEREDTPTHSVLTFANMDTILFRIVPTKMHVRAVKYLTLSAYVLLECCCVCMHFAIGTIVITRLLVPAKETTQLLILKRKSNHTKRKKLHRKV